MAEYKITWYSPMQQQVSIIANFTSLEYAWVENSIGVLKLVFPIDLYSNSWVARDAFFAVYRDNVLEMNTIWFLRKIEYADDAGTVTLIAYSANYIFGDPENRAGRIVISEAGNTTYSEFQDYADDIIKTLASQNVGLGALDTERDLSNYLTIAAKDSAGPIVSKSCSKALLLPLFQEICESARQEGTPIYFDIVCTRLPYAEYSLQLELRTYIQQRGFDLRDTIVVSKERGNISNALLTIDYGSEITTCYAAGSGEGALQPQEEYSDTTRLGASAFNRREAYIEVSSTADEDVLISSAKEVVALGKPKLKFSGNLIETPSFRYGIDWNFGDRIKAYSHGYTFDARISAISLRVSNESEAIEVNILGESDL